MNGLTALISIVCNFKVKVTDCVPKYVWKKKFITKKASLLAKYVGRKNVR